MLYGTSDAEPQTDIIVAQLAQELYNTNLLLLLIQVTKWLDKNICGESARYISDLLRNGIDIAEFKSH